MQTDPRDIMNTAEAAKYMGISRSYLQRLLRGTVADVPAIPHTRLGNRVLIRKIAIDEWLRANEVKP